MLLHEPKPLKHYSKWCQSKALKIIYECEKKPRISSYFYKPFFVGLFAILDTFLTSLIAEIPSLPQSAVFQGKGVGVGVVTELDPRVRRSCTL